MTTPVPTPLDNRAIARVLLEIADLLKEFPETLLDVLRQAARAGRMDLADDGCAEGPDPV